MDPEHLTRKVFEWRYQELDTGPWESNIYDIFELVDKLESFENAVEFDINHLEIKLADIMHDEWSTKLPSKLKLRTYSLFKNEIKTEDYILSNISKFKRSLLCQLRIGILPLEIETGRYTRKKVEDRICKLCKSDVEDEVHFVCVCSTGSPR